MFARTSSFFTFLLFYFFNLQYSFQARPLASDWLALRVQTRTVKHLMQLTIRLFNDLYATLVRIPAIAHDIKV